MVNVREIKAEMLRAGVTQKQLSEHLGLSQSAVYRRFRTGVFGTDEAMKIAEVLKMQNPGAIFFAEDVT